MVADRTKEILQLRVPLGGKHLEKFRALKKFFGVEANTEVFRLALNEAFRSVFHPRSKAKEDSR